MPAISSTGSESYRRSCSTVPCDPIGPYTVGQQITPLDRRSSDFFAKNPQFAKMIGFLAKSTGTTSTNYFEGRSMELADVRLAHNNDLAWRIIARTLTPVIPSAQHNSRI